MARNIKRRAPAHRVLAGVNVTHTAFQRIGIFSSFETLHLFEIYLNSVAAAIWNYSYYQKTSKPTIFSQRFTRKS